MRSLLITTLPLTFLLGSTFAAVLHPYTTNHSPAPLHALHHRDTTTTTTIRFCSVVNPDNSCGGACNQLTAAPGTCIPAPHTACITLLEPNKNVQFCNSDKCDGHCNQYTQCGDKLPDGSCKTPGTGSILVQPDPVPEVSTSSSVAAPSVVTSDVASVVTSRVPEVVTSVVTSVTTPCSSTSSSCTSTTVTPTPSPASDGY